MKPAEKLKSIELDSKIEVLLRDLLSRIPFLKVKSFQRFTPDFGSQPDWLVEVEAGDRPWVLAVEGKRQAQPREVRNAVLQLQRFQEQIQDKPCYGIVVAPFLSPESARLCTEAKMGYADLAGNARLSFDQVFIELQVADNPFRLKRHLRSLFTAKAGRVLRILLTPPLRAWKVAELRDAAGVSLGQVSNVRKLLLDGEWAAVDDAGLLLSKPEELVRAWARSYEPRIHSRETAYTLLHGEGLDQALRTALIEAGNGSHALLASYSAARWLAPYVRQGTHFFYADAIGAEVLRRHLQLQSVPGGGNVILWEPGRPSESSSSSFSSLDSVAPSSSSASSTRSEDADPLHDDISSRSLSSSSTVTEVAEDVFTGRLEAAPGIWCSGLVQTWLDLSVAGERGAEAAEQLLQAKLLPAWKEAVP